MANKVNTSLGPSTLTLSGSTGTTEIGKWIRFGPFKATNLAGRATYSAGTGSTVMHVGIQAILAGTTYPSTALAQNAANIAEVLSFNSTASSQKTATNTGIYSYVRLYSTQLSSGQSATVQFVCIS